eukprot:3463808-Amphidinium_carterae.1
MSHDSCALTRIMDDAPTAQDEISFTTKYLEPHIHTTTHEGNLHEPTSYDNPPRLTTDSTHCRQQFADDYMENPVDRNGGEASTTRFKA